jgi:hypothetical protein
LTYSVLDAYEVWNRRYRKIRRMKYVPWIWLGTYFFFIALFTALGVPNGPLGGLLVALIFAPGPLGLIHAAVSLLHYRLQYVPIIREGQLYVELGIACPACYAEIRPASRFCGRCGLQLSPESVD